MTNRELETSEVRTQQVTSKKHRFIKLGLNVHADTIVVSILDNAAPRSAQRFI